MTTPFNSNDLPLWLTTKQVADLVQVSTRTVSRWHGRGLLRKVKLGESKQSPARFSRDEILRFLNGCSD